MDEQEKALRDEIERSAQSDYIHEKLFDESDRLGSYPLPEESELSLRRVSMIKLIEVLTIRITKINCIEQNAHIRHLKKLDLKVILVFKFLTFRFFS